MFWLDSCGEWWMECAREFAPNRASRLVGSVRMESYGTPEKVLDLLTFCFLGTRDLFYNDIGTDI